MRRLCVLVLALAAPTAVKAELPSPRLDRIAPLGVSAGGTVEVEVAGADLEDVREAVFDHPGLKAEWVKDRVFRVTAAADMPAGTFDLRLVGKFGVTNPRLFAVSRGLTDVAEKEPNDEPAQAQPVALNSAVQGTCDNGRDDFYRITLKKGQRIVVECQAQKLDSLLDANLTLADTDGRTLASSADHFGRDPLIDFLAPRDGEYVVGVNDLSFRGGHPYRLVVTDRPRVENVFPRAVRVGTPATVTVLGRNLGPGSRPSAWKLGDLPLEERDEPVSVPADLPTGAYRFHEHPTTHSVLPTAATAALAGFTVRPAGSDDAVPILAADGPVTAEVEPNDDPHKPQAITLPAVVSGRFDRERDADWYEFEADEAGPYAFEVYCERIAGRADPYLVVLDDKDNRVGELDDLGPRVNAFDAHLRDPSGTVNLAAKRKYRVLVQDRYRRGGARFQYELTVRRPVPDFFAAVIHAQNPGPGGTTVRRGGAVSLDVVLHRRDGFDGPVTVTAEGLPKGLHAAPVVITGDSRGTFVLWADADTPDFVGPVRLVATGKRGDLALVREVRPYTRVWSQQDLATSRPTRELVVAVRGTAPFALAFAAERLEVEAGKKVEAAIRLTRPWADFKGAVTVVPLALPGPVKAGTVTVAEGKTEATVTFEVAAGAKPGEYTVAVQGQGQVPFAKDEKATKANTLSSQPSRPLTLVIRAAEKK
jgi:hypothetical protein